MTSFFGSFFGSFFDLFLFFLANFNADALRRRFCNGLRNICSSIISLFFTELSFKVERDLDDGVFFLLNLSRFLLKKPLLPVMEEFFFFSSSNSATISVSSSLRLIDDV